MILKETFCKCGLTKSGDHSFFRSSWEFLYSSVSHENFVYASVKFKFGWGIGVLEPRLQPVQT